MKPLKKALALMLAIITVCTAFAGCRNKNETPNTTTNTSKNTGKAQVVRYLNFKPEIADKYEAIAKEYEAETGVRVIIETAANNTYEQTLTAKMATSEAPTIFQINGPKGYASWKNYCADLKDTDIYKHLTDKDMAVKSGDSVYGIPYVVEGYGIIYNKEITDAYFALPDKATKYKAMSEITSFDALRHIVEDMQKNAAKLGITGVFSSTSLKAGEDWRWQTHLANIPVYYEFKNKNIDLASEQTANFAFEYAENYKNIFDLYLDNSVVPKKELGKKIVDESMAEFATGKSAMVQNGTWAWSQIEKISGNRVKAESIKYLPIYMGIQGEEKQGICIGTENFLAINSKATAEEQRAAQDFIWWLYSSEKGKKAVTNELGFIAPFDTFSENERPTDPLAKEVANWMNRDGVTNIPWDFTIFPSQTFKNDFGAVLLQYAQGTKTWADVKKTVVDKWQVESRV